MNTINALLQTNNYLLLNKNVFIFSLIFILIFIFIIKISISIQFIFSLIIVIILLIILKYSYLIQKNIGNNNNNFKSNIINNFNEKNKIKSIIDYGFYNNSNEIKLINTRNKLYIGLDVNKTNIQKCKKIFKNDKTKKFINLDEITNTNNNLRADLVLSFNIIYNLLDEKIYKQYIENIFLMSKKYVIIYSPNLNYNIKKINFIEYIFENCHQFNLIEIVKNKSPYPFYIFQKKTTYTPYINKNILQITKKDPLTPNIISKIKSIFKDYNYYWFNDENMYNYIKENQLEEFPNIIKIMKSYSKGQHKADVFRYYWLYLNGGIFMDDDLMIDNKLDFQNNTFISVKSYHLNKNLLFNGFIACSKFNPIIYKALQKCYTTHNITLMNEYHFFCIEFYKIYQELKKYQNTFLLQEKIKNEFKEGVKIYYNNKHILTHWCYNKKILNV